MTNLQSHRVSRRDLVIGSAAISSGLALTQTARAADNVSANAPVKPSNPIEQIIEIFGGVDFNQEAVENARRQGTEDPRLNYHLRRSSARSHAIQAAMQAESDGADEGFIAAAFLHDIGHYFSAPSPIGQEDEYDDLHELIGARWLENIFVKEVTESVLLHVPGKRYLVATRPEYSNIISSGSMNSLMRQGGPMTSQEIDEFENQPFWEWGVQVRIWDDKAKVRGFELPNIERFIPYLEASVLKG